MDELTEEKAREIERIHDEGKCPCVTFGNERNAGCYEAKGFLSGLSQARKEAEPLRHELKRLLEVVGEEDVEIIENALEQYRARGGKG